MVTSDNAPEQYSMQDPNFAAPVTPYPGEDLEKYTLTGRRQIRQLLQDLIDHHALIAVHIGNGASFVTALIRLTSDEDEIIIDVSPDPAITRRALASDRLLCVTQLERIRIQFSLTGMREVSEGNRDALCASVPERILRLQRREFYRLSVPLSHNIKCVLRTESADGEPIVIEARVLDISAGGVAVHAPPNLADFVIGSTLEGCTLQLPDADPIPLALEVRNIAHQPQRNGTELLRLGLQYVSMPRSADMIVQRYIFHTERERNARERGGI
jgi:flagellar brake protein